MKHANVGDWDVLPLENFDLKSYFRGGRRALLPELAITLLGFY